jgi:hypothetical protein
MYATVAAGMRWQVDNAFIFEIIQDIIKVLLDCRTA